MTRRYEGMEEEQRREYAAGTLRLAAKQLDARANDLEELGFPAVADCVRFLIDTECSDQSGALQLARACESGAEWIYERTS